MASGEASTQADAADAVWHSVLHACLRSPLVNCATQVRRHRKGDTSQEGGTLSTYILHLVAVFQSCCATEMQQQLQG